VGTAAAETTSGTLLIGPGQTLVVGPGAERHHTGPVFVYDGGRIQVNGGKLFLNGSMLISGASEVLFDSGEFHLAGDDTHVLVSDEARLAFSHGGLFHFAQTYVAQHVLRATGQARVELEGTRIDCDAATITIQLYDDASYSATATSSEDWSTWYMYDRSRLSLQWVLNGGDVLFYDAVTIDVRNTIGIMPWLYFPAGSVADLSFSEASHCDASDCPVVSKTIDGTNVRGIEWSVRIENSALVMWGIDSYPGSQVTVSDSVLAMALVRLGGDRTYVVPGEFINGSSHTDKTFSSLPDRVLRMVNSSVRWWKVDVIDSAQAAIDRIRFAEMMVMGSARALVTNSVCEGQTIHLGAKEDAFVHFQNGEVWTHVSAWDRSTMVLDRSLVDWRKGEYPYQSRNIAHGHARLYAVNSELISSPEAMNSSIVTFARLGSFGSQLGPAPKGRIPVRGSAWIATGPDSPVTFDRWTLAVRIKGTTAWRTFAQGRRPVSDSSMAWLYLGRPGTYEVKLTIFVRGDDPGTPHPTWAFPAIKELVVY
jgi:hypothetical protein